MRMDAARQDGFFSTGDTVRHHHRLGAGGGAVIKRSVGDLHPGQQGHLGLELEQVLQRSLRHLGLIRGIGGQELAALDQMVDRGGDVMAIGAAADEKRRRAGSDIPRRQAGDHPLDLDLALRQRQIERPVAPRCGRHIGKQIINQFDPDRGQHLATVMIGQRQIAHQDWPATKAL